MPQRTATIESLPMAFEVVKSMQADGLEWGESYRPLGRQALAEVIQGRMAEAVDYWLDSLDGLAMRDRRNGSYSRHLLSELGDIELSVPRTRRFCPSGVLKSYARRAPEIDRTILAGFVLGLPLRHPRRAQAGENHKRHRTKVPRGPPTHPAHGNFPRPHIHGPHPLCRLHPRKQISGSKHPLLPDT